MCSTFKLIPVIILTLMLQSCHDFKKKAGLIIYNATIITVDSSASIVTSLAVKEGRIVALGNDDEILGRFWSDNIIDANGLVVYPGFIDAHSHFTGYAEFLRYADLNNALSFDEVLQIITEYHKAYPDRWIIGRGWDQNKWPGKQFPEADRLDALFPDVPVILSRVDGHAVLANKAALKQAGLEVPFSKGEAILRDGKPTGVFLERTADLIKGAIPKPMPQEMTELLKEAAAQCHAAGLTGVNDAGLDRDQLDFLDSICRQDILKIRIDAMVNATPSNMDHYLPKGVYRTPYLRIGSVKIYADGALGSRGACLLAPYSDQAETYGLMVTDPEAMKSICKEAYQAGFQVNTHAIGDSAVRQVLSVYSEILGQKNDFRWRIEHAQVVHPDDFQRFGAYSIIPSIQATHATSDMYWAESRLGPSRVRYAYSYQKLLQQNGWLPNGTDFPIEKIDPLLTYYASVARKDLSGYPENGFQKESVLSRMETLKSITIWAARAAFQENDRGSLEVNKFADIVILDKNLLTIPEEEIPMAKVRYTIVNGEIVFKSKEGQ